MNIRFLAQSEYFNGIHIKDDIILEKEYEQGEFENIPKVNYFLYYLEENVRKEVMPHTDKVDIFKITDCVYESDYLYFTEYTDMLDGGLTFNIIRYNIIDHTHTKIISLKDDINMYPDQKEIKIYILDDSNLIIQRGMLKDSSDGLSQGFHSFSLVLFNYRKNKQIIIHDENLLNNGIDFIIPYADNSCIMKTGYPIFDSGISEEKDAAVESLIVLNLSQFVSDLQLEQQKLVLNPIDKCFFETTILKAKILENYLIYSKYNYNDDEENIVFYDLISKETYTCINKTSHDKSLLNYATVIEKSPYMIMKKSSGTEFLNLFTNEVENTYISDFDIKYVNNNTIISTIKEKNLWGKEKISVAIQKYPSKKVILQETGVFIGAVSSNSETTYIFLK